MTQHKRTLEFDRASVNVDTGEFNATLFTSGEATDGHILHIPGGEMPADMPLFVGHWADPVDQLGTLYPAEGRSDSTIPVRGHIETGGEGANADIRRDLLLKMANGHVKRMSGRWDADESHVKRRVDLPSEHYAHVSTDAGFPMRSGLFFEQWRAVEGSIVGLGADPQATMRWARDAESKPVAQFYEQHARASALENFSQAAGALLEAGLTPVEMIESIERAYKIERVDGELVTKLDAIYDLVSDLGERMTMREEPEPTEVERTQIEVAAPLPAVTLDDIARAFREESAEQEQRLEHRLNRRIEKARGRV